MLQAVTCERREEGGRVGIMHINPHLPALQDIAPMDYRLRRHDPEGRES